MNIFDRALGALGLERRSTNPNDPWASFNALRTGNVTAESAQSLAAVYAAVGVIAEALGTMPLKLYRRDGDSREVAHDHPLHLVLSRSPNEYQSRQEFIEWMSAAMLLHGNSFARVERGWDGQCRALIPLAPERVSIVRKGDALAGYEYHDRDGKIERLLPADVFHLRHRAGADPLVGQSPIQAARAVIELALSEQQHGVSTFNNGTRLAGLLQAPGKLRPEQKTSLRESWQNLYGGTGNAGRTAVLEEGMSFTPLSMTLEDSAYIAARQFSVQEVARIFKVPPPLLADLGEANYSNAQAMGQWFVKYTLARHMHAWEGAISRQLLTDSGRRIYHPEFSAEGLLRGSSTERSAFYSSAINDGWMLRSEVRRLESMPAIEGIDERESQNTTPTAAPQPYPSKERGE